MPLFDIGNIFRFFNKFTKDQIIIFMMHRFQDSSINYQTSLIQPLLSPDTLEDCLKYLVKNNYTILSFRDLIQAAQKHQNFYKTVCFTIDDGYIDFKNTTFLLPFSSQLIL